MGEWTYWSLHFYLSCRWRWMVKFMSQPLYPWGKSYQYALDRIVCGTQSDMDTVVKRKSLGLAVNKTLISWLFSPQHITHRLKCSGCYFVWTCFWTFSWEQTCLSQMQKMCAKFFDWLLGKITEEKQWKTDGNRKCLLANQGFTARRSKASLYNNTLVKNSHT